MFFPSFLFGPQKSLLHPRRDLWLRSVKWNSTITIRFRAPLALTANEFSQIKAKQTYRTSGHLLYFFFPSTFFPQVSVALPVSLVSVQAHDGQSPGTRWTQRAKFQGPGMLTKVGESRLKEGLCGGFRRSRDRKCFRCVKRWKPPLHPQGVPHTYHAILQEELGVKKPTTLNGPEDVLQQSVRRINTTSQVPKPKPVWQDAVLQDLLQRRRAAHECSERPTCPN